jgi:hypothetical protein
MTWRPVKLQKQNLEHIGVDLFSKDPPILRCWHCEGEWTPKYVKKGVFERAWWKCPNGCVDNQDDARKKAFRAVYEKGMQEFTDYDFQIFERYRDYFDRAKIFESLFPMAEDPGGLSADEYEDFAGRFEGRVRMAEKRGAVWARRFWVECRSFFRLGSLIAYRKEKLN